MREKEQSRRIGLYLSELQKSLEAKKSVREQNLMAQTAEARVWNEHAAGISERARVLQSFEKQNELAFDIQTKLVRKQNHSISFKNKQMKEMLEPFQALKQR